MCDNLLICNLRTQYFLRSADLQFADPIFCDLKLPQSCKKIFIFLLTNTYLKCSNSNFYQIKDSAKQTCIYFLIVLKRMFNSLCLMVENLRICNLWTGSATKIADLQFAICGSIKRNLQTSMSQKFVDSQLRIEPKNLPI